MPNDSRASALEGLLCFDLYAASRAVTAFYRPLLDELGLTYPQYLVVALLDGGEPRSVGEIGRDLQLDHGTLTPLLRRLESSGLLTRSRRETDERVVEVAITAQGQQVAAKFHDVQCRVTDAMGLDEAAARSMRSSLRRLNASVSPG